jgi:hypothetical protein
VITVEQITSGPRTIAKVARKRKVDEIEEPMPGFEARNELDTRADTICAGVNFLCIRPTGMMCSVKGFHQSFAPIHEIPVATVATAWDDPETGQTFILIVHQALYFGKQLDHSLINPNQIRVTGTPVCDDPFDRHRKLGIDTEETYIPFHTDGNTIYFVSRVPTQEELDDCPYITLTGDNEWDPSTTDLTDPMPKEVMEVSTTDTRSHEDACETDEVLTLISPIYTCKTLRNRVLKSMRIVNQVASQMRHTRISPESIARMWNIGLD